VKKEIGVTYTIEQLKKMARSDLELEGEALVVIPELIAEVERLQALTRETAERCGEIAGKFSVKAIKAIRHEFGLQESKGR